MTSQIVYNVSTIASGGQLLSTVIANVSQPSSAGTPGTFRDEEFLLFWGLRASADSTTSTGNVVNRQITLQMDASAVATATAVRSGGAPEGEIISVTVTDPGLDYIQRPRPIVIDATGSGAKLASGLQIQDTAQVVIGGSSYTADVTAVARGGLVPGGVPAIFSVTVVGGVITDVVCTNTTTNGPYAQLPTIVISDPGNPDGTAQWIARMGVHPDIQIIDPGHNYTAPTIAFVPWFKTLIPEGTDTDVQGQTVLGWMTGILSEANMMPFVDEIISVT